MVAAATFTGSGNIDITGTGGGGTGTGGQNLGVQLGGNVTATGAGNVTITGTGGSATGSNNNHGVTLANGVTVRATSGAVNVSGTAGTGAGSRGLYSNGSTLGDASQSGDIVFPKLDEERDMIPFERVAVDLLHALGMEPLVCRTEEEAREKMRLILRDDTSRPLSWPVYLFTSDTSGEKTYEEFFTPGEQLDYDTFVNLGVVKNAPRRPQAEIDAIFASLRALFQSAAVSKAKVVDVLKDYLPNFAHIETGKGLDQKM